MNKMDKNLFKYSLLFLVLITGCCGNTTSKKAEKSATEARNNVEKTTNETKKNDLREIPKNLFENGEAFKAIELALKPENVNKDIWKSLLAYYNYWGSYNTPINRGKALELANSSKNEPLSKAVLARFYLTGYWNIEKDLEKAEKLAEESYKEGCTEGLVILLNVLKEKSITFQKQYGDTLAISKSDTLSDSEKYKLQMTLMNFGERSGELYKNYKKSDYADIKIQNISEKILARNYNDPSKILKHIKGMPKDFKAPEGPYELLKPYVDAKNPQAFFLLAQYEIKQNNLKSFKDNLLKSINYGYSGKMYNYYINCKRNKLDISDGKKIAEHIIKTNNLSDLLNFYLLFNENEKVDNFLNSTIPENINWDNITKSGADNGSPAFMLIHALNMKDKTLNEYKKYIKQAEIMGAEEFVEQMIQNSSNSFKDKWLKIGLELKNKKSFNLMTRAYLEGKLFNKKIDVNINKALDILDEMVMCGCLFDNTDLTFINIIKDYNLLNIDNIKKIVEEYCNEKDLQEDAGVDFIFDDFDEFNENFPKIELNEEQLKKLYIISKTLKHPFIDNLCNKIENRFSKDALEQMNKSIEQKISILKENTVLRINKIKKYMNINEYY